MGYTTDFDGAWEVTPPLRPEHAEYLTTFSQTRRMERNASITEARPDPIREAVGLPVGDQGGYFVGEVGMYGQGGTGTTDVVGYNTPPAGQPGLWCQWVPNSDGTAIEWDGGEKFHNYVEWITYLLEHFLKPWGYTLNGEVEWCGEDPNDRGIIKITNNAVRVGEMLPQYLWTEV